jgi:hypothetical protein
MGTSIPSVPPSIICDSGHAEIVIIVLIILTSVFVRLWWIGRKENQTRTNAWRERMEEKLDKALDDHTRCRETLPERFVTKEEFRDLLSERNRQWEDFNEKFGKLMDRFWTHCHDEKGKVERMPW